MHLAIWYILVPCGIPRWVREVQLDMSEGSIVTISWPSRAIMRGQVLPPSPFTPTLQHTPVSGHKIDHHIICLPTDHFLLKRTPQQFYGEPFCLASQKHLRSSNMVMTHFKYWVFFHIFYETLTLFRWLIQEWRLSSNAGKQGSTIYQYDVDIKCCKVRRTLE